MWVGAFLARDVYMLLLWGICLVSIHVLDTKSGSNSWGPESTSPKAWPFLLDIDPNVFAWAEGTSRLVWTIGTAD